MSFLKWVGVLTALTLAGCAPVVKLQPPLVSEVLIEPGKYTVNGKPYSVPWDTTYSIANGILSPHASGFKLEPLIGADIVGLKGSPWAGLRFLHIENVGMDFGFDRENFTTGIDWLWHDLVLGPSIAFPYDLSGNQFQLKAAFAF